MPFQWILASSKKPQTIFAVVNILIVVFFLLYDGISRYGLIKDKQNEILSVLTAGVANEIDLRLSGKRQAVKIFAHDRAATIRDIYHKQDNGEAFEKLKIDTLQNFSSAFAVSVTNLQGEPLIDSFDGNIGKMCLNDTKQFANNSEQWQGPYIHPSQRGYHYDIVSRIPEGIFFVSFYAHDLAQLLHSREVDGHRLMLIARHSPNLIEISGKGVRDQLNGDFKLSKQDQSQIVSRIPINNSGWDLVLIRNPALLTNAASQIIWRNVIFGVFFIVVISLLAWLANRSDKAKLAAQNANNFKTRFLATISHDIRTPLNIVFGSIQLLENSSLDHSQRQRVHVLRLGVEQTLHLLNDLLEVSRIESGRMPIEHESVNLDAFAEEIQELFANAAEDKGLAFDISIDKTLPEYFNSDRIRLKQVLSNFIGNAIKFTDSGRIDVKIEKRINSEQTALIRFSVTDTGNGLTEQEQSNLFEAYEQLNTTITAKYGGSGLGLSICRQLANLMNGEVGVESSLGQGSTFYFQIPLIAVQVTSTTTEASQAKENHPLRLLVIEDDYLSRIVTSELLVQKGHHVDTAENAEEALRLLEKNRYDLIIADGHLPDASGKELCILLRNQLSQLDIPSSVPIIALTGDAGPGQRASYMAAGFDDYIAKPLDEKKLSALIGRRPMTQVEKLTESSNPSQSSLLSEDCVQQIKDLGGEKADSMLAKTIDLFLNETKHRLAALKAAINDEDIQAIKDIAHSIKGPAATIGSAKIIEQCKLIESADLATQIMPCIQTIEQELVLINEFQKSLDK